MEGKRVAEGSGKETESGWGKREWQMGKVAVGGKTVLHVQKENWRGRNREW